MKKIFWLLKWLFILALLASIVVLWRHNYGYVLITDGQWRLENTLNRFLVLAIPAVILLYISLRFILFTWFFPKHWRDYRYKSRQRRAQNEAIQGWAALAEHNPERAEKLLLRDIDDSPIPLLNYILAARAAQQLGAPDRREDYLKKAYAQTKNTEFAIGLVQAELQMKSGEQQRAVRTLRSLHELKPKHPVVLRLLIQLYADLNEWENLVKLLPMVHKHNVLSAAQLEQLEQAAYSQFLCSVKASNQIYDLQNQWRTLPKSRQQDPKLIAVYVDCLQASKQFDVAEQVLAQFLSKNWDEELAELYSEIKTDYPDKQLNQAEAWFKRNPRSSALLLTLARLSWRLKLWGKAKAYYGESIQQHPTTTAYAEFADLLQSQGDVVAANQQRRLGLELAINDQQMLRQSNAKPNYPAVIKATIIASPTV